MRVEIELRKLAVLVFALYWQGDLRAEWLQPQLYPSSSLFSSTAFMKRNLSPSWKKATFSSSTPPGEADLCLTSRFAGEDKLVPWNASDLLCENSTAPEYFKEQQTWLIQTPARIKWSVWGRTAWHFMNINISLAVCRIGRDKNVMASFGEKYKVEWTIKLNCKWKTGKGHHPDREGFDSGFKRRFEVNKTSMMNSTAGKLQMDTDPLVLISILTVKDHAFYKCLVMDKQRCLSSHSIEEAAVLHCYLSNFSDDRPPCWMKYHLKARQSSDSFRCLIEPGASQNFWSPMFMSATVLLHLTYITCWRAPHLARRPWSRSQREVRSLSDATAVWMTDLWCRGSLAQSW